MKRTIATIGILATVLAAACTSQPASPTAASAVSAESQSAKPGGGNPPATTHDLTFEPSIFGDPGSDGYPSPGQILASSPAAGVQGWITGPNANGWYKAAAAGAYTLLITDVSDVPGEPGDPCTEAQQTTLRDSGVLAAAVSGNLSLSVGEYTSGNTSRPTMNWELSNIASTPGYTWRIAGHSGSVNPLFFPQFDPSSSTTALIVTVENSAIDFHRYPTGARKPDLTIAKCRADFTMRLTKR